MHLYPSTATPLSTDYKDATTADLDKTIQTGMYVKTITIVKILPVVMQQIHFQQDYNYWFRSMSFTYYTFTVNVASGGRTLPI
jgi:hypothetical protein